jgi:hypothetical protein
MVACRFADFIILSILGSRVFTTQYDLLLVTFVALRHHCRKVGKGNGDGRGLLS